MEPEISKAVKTFDQQLEEAENVYRENIRNGFSTAQELLEQSETESDSLHINQAKELLSRCYQGLGNYNKALQYSLEALQYFESVGELAWAARCLNNVGAAYNFLGEMENRLTTNLKCLSFRRKGGDEQGEISSLNNIGDTYNQLGNHSKALEYFQLCLEFSSINIRTKTIVIHNIGETEFFKKEYDKAITYFLEALELSKESQYYLIEQAAYHFLARIFLIKNQLDEATNYLNEASRVVTAKNYVSELPPIIQLKAEIEEKKGNSETAMGLYKQYIQLSEQRAKENNINAMQDMQFAYRIDKLQEENSIHKEKNKALRQTFLKIEQQKRIIEEKNRSITDSINYALKIQHALLPSLVRFRNAFPESFIFNQPRDIVSGDFYWIAENENHLMLALADCTGHGVPGALMSIIGINLLDQAVSELGITNPASILKFLDEKIVAALNMGSGVENSSDGMDITLVRIHKTTREVSLASANRPVFHIRGEAISQLNPDKLPIGEYYYASKIFTEQNVKTKKGDKLYLFSDGYVDQFGGERGKKLKLKEFRNLIQSLSDLSMEEQEKRIDAFFTEWKGNREQVDDVLVIGISV
jgi:serine phosphatase RsbU (regulator of sigma subunit)